MPIKTRKQLRTMLAIAHGWRPRDPKLRKITRKQAMRILGWDEGYEGKGKRGRK